MKCILSLILAFVCLHSFAQNDPKAKKILDEVSNKVKTYKTVQASYTLNITNRAGKNIDTKAGLVSWKGEKYAMTDKSLQLYCDGQKVWKYEPAANEVSVSTADNDEQSLTPKKLFTNFYEKDFTYKLIGKKMLTGKSSAEIELTPINKNKSVAKIFLYIDEIQKMIMAIKSIDNSGNTSTYSISNLKSNIALADNMFTFDKSKHSGVEEIDQ